MKHMAAALVATVAVLLALATAQETITRENWGASVGFAPQPPADFTPGTTIDAGNVDRFATLVPEAARVLIKKYGMAMPTRAYEPYAPSDGYIAATNAHRGAAKLVAIGDATTEREIQGYEGGLPFPQPADGRQVMWDFTLGYVGDDGDNTFAVYWIAAKRGVERFEVWRTMGIRRVVNRTDVPPIPTVTSLESQGVFSATLTQALRPADKKGFASLYFGYLEPKEPDGWLYLPPQRRTVRLSFGTRGESWNSTDMLYEDIRGYTGSPEWMDWKIVEKTTLLGAMHAGVPQGEGREGEAFNLTAPPYWNPTMQWEPRPVYVIEATPKLRGYPYSKMILTVDAESFVVFTKLAYDRKGQLWKVLINGANASPDPAKLPPEVGLSLIVDVQSEHATAFFWHEQKANVGIKPEIFRLSTLRKMGR